MYIFKNFPGEHAPGPPLAGHDIAMLDPLQDQPLDTTLLCTSAHIKMHVPTIKMDCQFDISDRRGQSEKTIVVVATHSERVSLKGSH